MDKILWEREWYINIVKKRFLTNFISKKLYCLKEMFHNIKNSNFSIINLIFFIYLNFI